MAYRTGHSPNGWGRESGGTPPNPEEGQSAVTTAALSNPAPTTPERPVALVALVAPGEMKRLTRDYLVSEGVPVKLADDQLLVAPAARPRSKRKARETRAARCTLDVADDADVRLIIRPWAAETADGHWLADIAAALLTGSAVTGACHPGTEYPAEIGVKGAAGMDLRDRGFGVRLNAFEDLYCYRVTSDISVTAPGADGRGTPVEGVVYVADDGTVTWERAYWHQHPVTGQEPDTWSSLPEPSAAARAIAGTVTAAVRAAWPELTAG